jgi:hypothetical protein
MIEQYLPQINESVTVAKSKIFSHLDMASEFGEKFYGKFWSSSHLILKFWAVVGLVLRDGQ